MSKANGKKNLGSEPDSGWAAICCDMRYNMYYDVEGEEEEEEGGQ